MTRDELIKALKDGDSRLTEDENFVQAAVDFLVSLPAEVGTIYEWMLNNPSDVMLAYFEATNNDTFGGRAPTKEEQRDFLRARLPELMAQSALDMNSERS